MGFCHCRSASGDLGRPRDGPGGLALKRCGHTSVIQRGRPTPAPSRAAECRCRPLSLPSELPSLPSAMLPCNQRTRVRPPGRAACSAPTTLRVGGAPVVRCQSPQPTAALSRCALLSSHDGDCLRITDQVVVAQQKRIVVLGEQAVQPVNVALRAGEQPLRLQPGGGTTVVSRPDVVMPVMRPAWAWCYQSRRSRVTGADACYDCR